MFSYPKKLGGPCVIIEPVQEKHRLALKRAAKEDESIWDFFPVNFNGCGDDFDRWFDYTITRQHQCDHYPFTIIRKEDSKIIGTTRYYDMEPDHKRLAIGSTWYSPDARGTLINPEVRLITLTYAFEILGVNRVEMITDPHNLVSRAAMKILGAYQEGVIRNHLVYKDGRVRDSVLFSIIQREWPITKSKLQSILGYTSGDVEIS